MFQPIINQVGPALIEQGYRSAANSELAGAQALASGIQSGASSLAQGVGSAVADWSERSAQMKANAGTLDSMGKSKIFPQEWLDKVSAEKDPDKLRGNLEFMKDYAADQMMQKRQIAVADAGAMAASKVPQFIPTVVDVGNGRQAVTQSRGSAQLIPPAAAPRSNAKVIATEGGFMSVDPVSGQGTVIQNADGSPVMPVSKAKPDPVRAAQVMALDGEIAGLSSEIANGNKQWGPDWMPGMTSYADQLRAKQAERDALAAGGGRQPAAAPQTVAPAAAAGGVDRAAAIQQAQQAIQGGADPAAVKARLQQMGIQ